ncbi:MAG: tRNA lysidine(34) synthetase TilS [Victivallaceae bacterium]|nr:tRNA lysidine(34) synthetase TilS [Victivallaceae bacterium]
MNIFIHKEEAFRRFENKTLLVGFSGGADSTAALLMTLHFARKFNIRTVAVHFNHHLRGDESDGDETSARNLAERLNCEFIKVDLAFETSSNVEANAREARIESWKKLAAEYNAAAVVTGHHADDRLENLLLRLGRGSNATGLTSMRSMSRIGNVVFVRPLLDLHKEDIVSWLNDKGIPFRTDSSNLDSTYLRNKLRNEIIPLLREALPGSGAEISISRLEEDARFIESETSRRYKEGDTSNPDFWKSLPSPIMGRALRMFIRHETGCDRPISSGIWEEFSRFIAEDTPGTRRLSLGEGVVAVVSGGKFSIEAPDPESVTWNWRADGKTNWGGWKLSAKIVDEIPKEPKDRHAYFDADALPPAITIGTPVDGDTMIPFGSAKQKALRKLRIDRKVPAYPAMPVLRTEQGIIWAPGIRHGALFAVTKETRNIVRLSCRKKKKD